MGLAVMIDRMRRRGGLGSIAFYIVAIIAILVLGVMFGGVLAGLAFFGAAGEGPGYEFPESHRWHDVQWFAHTGVLLVGSLVVLLRNPASRPVLMQFFIGATVLLSIGALIFGHPEYLVFTVLAIVLGFLYPNRAGLLDLHSERDPIYLFVTLGLTMSVGVALLPEAIDKLDLQRASFPADEHAEHLHWLLGVIFLAQYLSAGLLVSSGRPGGRALAMLVGTSLACLGLGGLVLHDASGVVAVWSGAGSTLALAAGGAFIALGVYGHRLATARSRGLVSVGD